MTKTETLQTLEEAKKYHKIQMNKVLGILKGREVDNPTPPLKTKCSFGKWLYSNEKHLKKLMGLIFFNDIEIYHEQWHNEYSKIYNFFYKNNKKVKKVSQMDMDKANLYYAEMEESSKKLLQSISSSQKRLNALNESRFLE